MCQYRSAKCDMPSLIVSWLTLMEYPEVCFLSWKNLQSVSSDWIQIREKIWHSFFTFRTNRDTTEEIGLDVSRLKIWTLNLISVRYSTSLFFFQEGTVTKPSLWLVRSAVRIFLPLPMGTVTHSLVVEYIPGFVANFFTNIYCFTG